MDPHVHEMLLTAYEETRQDALTAGHNAATAHAEGLTAAAMLLAAVTGLEDAAARAQVDGIDFRQEAA